MESKRTNSLIYHNRIFNNLDTVASTSKSSNDELSILHHNVCSLINKHSVYQSLQLHNQFDIISLNETWLQPSIPNSFIDLVGFHTVRYDRANTAKTRGGGVALFIKDSLSFTKLSQPNILLNNLCESTWIKIKTASKPIIIASIYLSPDSDKKAFIEGLTTTLSSPTLVGKEIILVGDFNLNWNKPSPIKTTFEHSLAAFGLSQHVVGLTHVSHLGNESLIDLNFATDSLNVKKCSVLTTDISDHYCTHLILSTSTPRNPRRIIETRSYKHFDPHRFIEDASRAPFMQLAKDPSLSINQKVQELDGIILNLLDRQVPVRRIRVRGAKCPWMTTHLQYLIKTRNKFHRTIFNSPTPSDNQVKHYLKFRNFVTNRIRNAKRFYYSQVLSSDRQSFFRCLQTFTGKVKSNHTTDIKILKYNDIIYSDHKQIANSLNHFFTHINSDLPSRPIPNPNNISHSTSNSLNCSISIESFHFQKLKNVDVDNILMKLKSNKRGGVTQIPTFVYQTISHLLSTPLSIIINESITTCVFPDCLKLALVTPIYKKGDRNDPSNYRPISSLPILSKIFETALHQQLSTHLETHNLLSNRQFGYRHHHSAEQLLVSLLQEWYTAIDNGSYVTALSLDVRKAFDSINHSILLTKLRDLHLSSPSVNLLQSYLTDRKQIMKVSNTIVIN